MSDSSSNGSFLLEELGLNNGSSTNKSNKKTKAKAKKKNSSTKRKPISLDEIMKSMGIDSQEEQKSTPTIPSASTPNENQNLNNINDNTNFFIPQPQIQQPIYSQPQLIQPQINFLYFENKITDYLNNSLKMIVDEFSIELSNLFQFNDQFDEKISSFLDSIKQTIRDEINFSIEEKTSFLNCYEPFLPEFRNVYYEIERMKNLSIPQKISEIKAATASISSYIPTVNSRFSHEEITNELNELSSIRSQYKTIQKKLFQLKRNSFLNQIDLECKSRSQKMESEILQMKMQQLENERSNIDIFDDNASQKSSFEQTRKLRKLIHDLLVYNRKRKEKKQKWYLQEIKDTRNEINYYRQLNSYQNALFDNKFKEVVNQSRNQSFLSKTMTSQIINPSSFLPQQSQMIPQNSFIQPSAPNFQPNFTQANSVIVSNQNEPDRKLKSSDKNNSGLSGPELIDQVQKKLKKAQENNQNSLIMTTRYLKNLKKKEKKRARQHISQILDFDNEFI